MLLNPFYPFTFVKITSLKATIVFLSILLIKSNLLRLKGGLIGGLITLILISGILASTSFALGSLVYVYRLKKKCNPDEDKQMQDLETVSVWVYLVIFKIYKFLKRGSQGQNAILKIPNLQQKLLILQW